MGAIALAIIVPQLLHVEVPWEEWVVQYILYLSIILMLHGIYRIFIGIMGVTNCKKTHRGTLLLILGIGDTILVILPYVLSMVVLYIHGLGTFGALAAAGLPFSFVLPVLYIIGAVKNRKAFQNGLQNP